MGRLEVYLALRKVCCKESVDLKSMKKHNQTCNGVEN